MAQSESTIFVYTADHGRVTLQYGKHETILDLKHRLQTKYGYVCQGLQLSFSGGLLNSPAEQVEDARLVRDFALRQGVLRLAVAKTSQPSHLQATNTIGKAKALGGSSISVGDEISLEALQAILQTSGQLPRANNDIRDAHAEATATVRAGQLFGNALSKCNRKATGNERPTW